ncbi:MAG: aminopeptidase [Desulfobacterales bacterium]
MHPECLRKILYLLLGVVFMVPAGCESVRYYSHIASGQMHVVNQRQSIPELIAAPGTDPQLKRQLQQILEIRNFAQKELSLPVGSHYLSYTALDRPYVIWNVSAAPEFSFAPKTWYYPFIGHAAYRGYFSKDMAVHCAEQLEKQGLDVYVGGVTAYSTLGWFSDTVFSTIIRRDESATAALIFHELAHQILYVSDDTTFNESFATTVEQEGLRRWMATNGNPLGYQAYVLQSQRRQEFLALVTKYHEKLAELYRQENMVPEEMRRRKAALLADMRDEYADLKADWLGYAGYDNWFDPPLNNAKLNSVGAYYDLVPAFTQLLASRDGSLEAFYRECRILAELPKSERNRRLLTLQSPAVADASPVGQTGRR